MKKTLRSILVVGIGAGLLEAAVAADNNPAAPPPAPVPQAQLTAPGATNALKARPGSPPRAPQAQEPPVLIPGFKDQKEQMSYGIGMSIGKNIKQGMIDLDVDVLTGAIKDFVAGKTMRMTDEQMTQGIRAYQSAANAKREEERVATAAKNHKLGEAFMAENAKKEGVKIHSVKMPDGKTVDMQYKVITEGTGAIPKSNDVVNVKYRGTTIDGKEFDNSSKRGPGPVKMMVGRAAFPGWGAAWQIMKVGSKWELYIPAALARGDRPIPPNVEAGSTLIYEMELVSIEPPAAPKTAGSGPAPLTSDIVKVPSAAEIKKGAQPKILKPEDVQREMQSASTNGASSAK
jgi:FKBP-type peptidyl-prolyl cis-trans isomerase